MKYTVGLYELPSFNLEALDDIIHERCKAYGFSFIVIPSFRRHYKYYRLWPIGKSFWTRSDFLEIEYKGFRLYIVACTDDSAVPLVQSIANPYVVESGGKAVYTTPRVLNQLEFMLWSLRKPQQAQEASKDSIVQPLNSGQIVVHLDPDEARLPIDVERVVVRANITHSSRRAWTFEKTIESSWALSGGVELGVDTPIKATIKGEIERVTGQSFGMSQTIECAVQIAGAETPQEYEIIWTGVWRRGSTYFQLHNRAQTVEFKFLQRIEADSRPIGGM